MSDEKQCFRCGKPLDESFSHNGETVIAGFYSRNSPAYFNSYRLCEDCNVHLLAKIDLFLYEKKHYFVED